MKNYERYKKYIELTCPCCKNKDTNLCEIRISYFDGIIKTRCAYYEKDKSKIEKPIKYYVTAKRQKPLMRF